MPDNPSAPPDSDGSETDAEQAAWEMATAETLRARGELAEAATWYRRAANHLMEAGDDERAISIAKLAAELAALDDAGRTPRERARSEPVANAPGGDRSRAPAPVAPAVPVAPAPGVPRPGLSSLANPNNPNSAGSIGAPGVPRPRAPGTAPAPRSTGPGASASTAGVSVTAPRPALGSLGASRPAPGGSVPRAGVPEIAPPRPPSALPSSGSGAASERAAGQGSRAPDGRSAIAALVDEAVSNIEELPPSPLSSENSRRPLSFSPSRVAEAERISTRLPALPLFAELPAERLRDVGREAGVVRLNASEPLCEAGAPEGPLFVILEGAAWVGLAGENSPAAIATAGDFVGEIAALYGGPRTASVLAQGSVEAIALPPSLVRALSREFESFRDSLRETARERMAESLPRLAPILRRLEPAARREVFKQFEMATIPEGEVLLLEGDPAACLYLVAGGEVELYGGELGHTRTQRARVGEALGVASAITGEPSGVSARAPREVLVARISRAKLRGVLEKYPEINDAAADVGVPGRGVVC